MDDILRGALGGRDGAGPAETVACNRIAEAGRDMDVDLRKAVRQTIEVAGPDNYFAALIVHGFTWSDHAKDKDAWWDLSIAFLATGKSRHLAHIPECCGRFGAERCEEALRSWGILYKQFRDRFEPRMTGEEILAAQSDINVTAVELHRDGGLPGIGCWLPCAPFKMLLLDQEHTYEDPMIDDVLPPLGLEVVRGVKKCMKAGYRFADRLAPSDLTQEDGGAIDTDGLGTVCLVHDMERRISAQAACRALPINSGLWLLGNGDLVL